MIVEAVRIFHLRRSVNGAALMRQVSICRVEKDMRPYLSAILVMAAGEAWAVRNAVKPTDWLSFLTISVSSNDKSRQTTAGLVSL